MVLHIAVMTAAQEQILKEFETLCTVDMATLWGGAVTEQGLTNGVEAVEQQLLSASICSK